MKIPLLALILVVSISVYGQRPIAIPVDEFRRIGCGDLLARIDNFFIQLINNPQMTAYIVLAPGKSDLRTAENKKQFIENIFNRRKFDTTRLRIVRDMEADSEIVKFYLLPAGAVDPVKDAVAWPEKKLDLASPFIFGVERDEDPCPDFPLPKYAELLRSNPDLRGHVVIFPNTLYNQNATKQRWLIAFTGIRRSRVNNCVSFLGNLATRPIQNFGLYRLKRSRYFPRSTS